jgi:two-component system cell cycle sensor histidine kinase/response regulator CckA
MMDSLPTGSRSALGPSDPLARSWAPLIAIILLGHLAMFVAWYDDVGPLAGLFVLPAGLVATVQRGTRGAYLAVAWALFWNALLGANLPQADGAVLGLVHTLFHPQFLLVHGSLALILLFLGRQHDLSRALESKVEELARTRDALRDAERIRDEARLTQQLSRTERMASVGTLASGVAHEVNNPLTYVIGNLYYALEELERADEQTPVLRKELSELLRDALDGAQRVRRIVRDLKTFARAADDESEQRLDVNQNLETAVNLVNNELRHRARLSLSLSEVPRVLGSEPKLVQAFVNLLMNAAQAIPEGRADSELIEVRSQIAAVGRVRIDFRDSGRGMNTEELARIFDPIFTARSSSLGSGLGLSVAHSIIQGMGGELLAQSKQGEGSTFSVILPAEQSAQSAVAIRRSAPPLQSGFDRSRAHPSPAPRARRLRVLVIDDEPKVGVSLRRMLRDWDVLVIEDGRDALTLLARDRSFDAVLCDLMMPHLTGMDLFEEIRGVDADLARRFVFMTGGAFTPKARAFVADVTNTTLEKPFEKRHVLSAVETIMREAPAAT